MSLFSDFLTALGVKHTADYSDRRFRQMPFQTMFGLSSLLKEYGVGTAGIKVPAGARADALAALPAPFLADTADGFAIVTKVADGKVNYISQHKPFTVPASEMLDGWNGIALIASADASAIEPDYMRHHVGEIAVSVKKWILAALCVILPVAAMWASGLYAHWAAWAAAILDCAGIWLSWMLVQKSLGIHNATAESVCSALEAGGCDEIARSEAASFMGIFKWSEVGLAYFSISLLAMLLFPAALPALAAINILCLPYTVWSITYQKFKAKTWCTLCVCVQATLWLLFACYLLGGYTAQIFPVTGTTLIIMIALACTYAAALLGINRLDDAILKYINTYKNDNATNS